MIVIESYGYTWDILVVSMTSFKLSCSAWHMQKWYLNIVNIYLLSMHFQLDNILMTGVIFKVRYDKQASTRSAMMGKSDLLLFGIFNLLGAILQFVQSWV